MARRRGRDEVVTVIWGEIACGLIGVRLVAWLLANRPVHYEPPRGIAVPHPWEQREVSDAVHAAPPRQ